jgi:broad-specificity NMP kinase
MQIFVTGVAGSGKSALCRELNNRRVKALDIEKVKGLFQMVNIKTGKPVGRIDVNDPTVMKQHEWACNQEKLQEILEENRAENVYYCGTGANISSIVKFFDKTFLLLTNEKTLKERLTNRTPNGFGKTPEAQEWIFTWKEEMEQNLLNVGAIPIDANQPLSQVADEILRKS